MAVVAPAMLLTMTAAPVVAAPGDPVSKNVALASAGATVTASGNEQVGVHQMGDAIDGDATSRWSSNTSDTASLTVKLAQPTLISKVVIKWEAACAAKYKLQVSTNGVDFIDATDVQSRPDCAAAANDAPALNAGISTTKYQYVRMQGIDRTPIGGAKWGISLFEFEVWDTPAAPAANVALAASGATVTATGQEVAGQWGPALVIDGDADRSKPNASQSRWSSNTADNAAITVKLAQPTLIDHVTIDWEKACAAQYKLQVSNDGNNFTDATDVISPTCDGRDSQKIKAALAATPYQYIRMQGIARTPIGGVKYGMSMWEFEVWTGPEPVPVVPAAGINLIPMPVNMTTPDKAPFVLGAGSRIVANNAETKATGNYLAGIFRASTGLALPVVDGTTGDSDDIVLSQTPGDIANLGAGLQSEAYSLSVDPVTGTKITSATSDGVFDGVQTLRQLFPAFIESKQKVIADWTAPAVQITDAPRFDKRGMMLDVARDFKRPDEVKHVIDSLAAYKISTLHIHLADDQGWRIQITNDGKVAGDTIDYSLLTGVSGKTAATRNSSGGAMGFQDELGHTGFYTQDEYKDIVAYAASRHIEVIPEIDVPGHTNAALHAIPQLNTAASKPGKDESGVVPANGTGDVGYSTLDVAEPATWNFLTHVYTQIAAMTPGKYIHVGGDESHATPHDDYVNFITKTVKIIHDLGKQPIGWNEAAVGGLQAGDGIQYWTGGTADTLSAINTKGAKLMVSNGSTSYIDMKYNAKTPIGLTWAGTGDFPKYYDWDPAATVQNAGANLPDASILGVEAAQWSETIRGGDQAEFMAFPRVVSFAEIGWTPQAKRNVNDFKVRMAAMGQRMLTSGTNFYDGNNAKWSWSMAGSPVAVAPGKALNLAVGQLAAPGTKVAANGATIAVDSVDDADGVSASTVAGNLGVTVNWGDGTAATPATFAAKRDRTSLSAGSLYTLKSTHSYAAAGNFNGTLTASDGTVAKFTVTVAAGTADPQEPTPWDTSQTAAMTAAPTTKAGDRLQTALSGFEPGKYVTMAVGTNVVGTVLPDANGTITFQLPVPPSIYSGSYALTATQGTRVATGNVAVTSTLVPLANKIPQNQLTIKSVDSQEMTGEPAPNGPAAAALDGDPNTYWHTQWSGSSDPFPHSLVLDLGKSFNVTGFEYTQRQSNTNGKMKDYEIYVSDSLTDFGTKVASGTFLDVNRAQVVTISGGKVGRYVKFVGLNSMAGNAFGGAAELNVGGIAPGATVPDVSANVGTIKAGGTVDLSLKGFAANTPVSLSLHSTPVDLGTVTTDANGAATKTVTIPSTIEAGNHTIVATAGAITASFALTVAPADVPTTEPTTEPTSTPTTDPTETTTPTTDPTTDPTDSATPTTDPTDSATPTTDPTESTTPTIDPTTNPTSDPTGSTAPTTSGTSPAATKSATGTPPATSSAAAPAGTPSATSAPSTDHELASTGANTTPFLLGGLVLVLVGVVSFTSRRKRKSTHA
ncbi:family 20 glycosylhydrolase [Arthrobacter sp. ERGS1:01]|uniref:family 20 glycosylhydrolase n=1 Tax=Arthrobacter sp. ERGS1:01 TaxID=1704044 RepID=UPI0013649930|nr:family 20 glycosylhydrolase [Arthrobacter sp. ERGS1:01]